MVVRSFIMKSEMKSSVNFHMQRRVCVVSDVYARNSDVYVKKYTSEKSNRRLYVRNCFIFALSSIFVFSSGCQDSKELNPAIPLGNSSGINCVSSLPIARNRHPKIFDDLSPWRVTKMMSTLGSIFNLFGLFRFENPLMTTGLFFTSRWDR